MMIVTSADAPRGFSDFLSFETEKADTYYVAVLHWETLYQPVTYDMVIDPKTPGSGSGVDGNSPFSERPLGTGNYRVTIATDTVGPGVVENASVPVRRGQPILVLVSGENGASGDFTLDLTNLDQFTTPENDTLLFPAGPGPSSSAIMEGTPWGSNLRQAGWSGYVVTPGRSSGIL